MSSEYWFGMSHLRTHILKEGGISKENSMTSELESQYMLQ